MEYQNWPEATKFELSQPEFSLRVRPGLRPSRLVALPPPPPNVESHDVYLVFI